MAEYRKIGTYGRRVMPRSKTKTCTAHCRTCGRHFASNSAFDRHRGGLHGEVGFHARHCTDPDGHTRGEESPWYVTVVGDCRIESEIPSIGVDIHQEAAAVERGHSLRAVA